jgi:hypothetical protein
MRPSLLSGFAVLILAAVSAFAQTPTFTVVNTGLDATFGNAGKAVLDPQAYGLVGVAYGNGLFVAVAASARESVVRWATSPDGTTWTARSQALPNSTLVTFQTSKVHFLNGKFIFFTGFGDNLGGVIGTNWCYSSTDGLTWTANKVSDGRINVVEFDASPTLTVAAASNGAQVASTDLVTWVSRPILAGGSGYDHNDVAYFNGKFFSSINGFGGTTYSSSDTITWTALSTLTLPGGSRVEAGNGFLVGTASGSHYKSTDGVTFSKITTTAPTGWFAPGGSPRYTSAGFVALGTNLSNLKGGYMVSSDAVAWTPIGMVPDAPAAPSGFISRSYIHYDITYGAGKYVLVGQDTSQAAFSIVTLPMVMTLTAAAAPTPPAITTQPVATSGVLGGSASFTVIATGSANTYQWWKDNAAISGATSATLSLSNLTVASAGSYTVVITNSAGSATSAAATLSLVTANNAGRLVNLSIRSQAGTGAQTLIVGVTLGGAGTSGQKPLLVRGIGPALTPFGVTNALGDPMLTVYQNATVLTSNDDWNGDAQIGATGASVGAFPLSSTTSKDSALFGSIAPGSYTVQITGNGGTTGVALAEIYDATPAGAFSITTPRLINVSARTQVGTGNDILIAGFVIGGSTTKTVLIRAVGPTLTDYGVTGVLANPRLELYAGSTKLNENDDWGGATSLVTAAASVGAFPLPATSKDSVLLVTLPPGAYTAQVSGVNNTTGVGLIEVYEAP